MPPLTGIRVLELAGLAPGPFAGMVLADYGATVLRVDRASAATHSSELPPPALDPLCRHKTSISVNTKTPSGVAFLLELVKHVDVVIDPFRPGVLEKMGLGPPILQVINPRIIVVRLTGFRRDGKYSQMAGHDINYLAVSGVLSLLGRKDEPPYAPGNMLGDFAGGGLTAATGVLLAIIERSKTGKGQVVEANIVDGSAYLATFPRLTLNTIVWDQPRGYNILDGGCPWYDAYETNDGHFMAVGAIEPQFFQQLINGLGLNPEDLPGPREDRDTWNDLRKIFASKFKTKDRYEWEKIFDGTDACCTPVLKHDELRKLGFDQRPFVTLRDTPGLAMAKNSSFDSNESIRSAKGHGEGVEGEAWESDRLPPSSGGEQTLKDWLEWKNGVHYQVIDGGLVLKASNSKL